MGLGMGNIFAPAIASATYGVDPRDAGVASAMVNTMQQVGGSIGTALLSSIFASSVSATPRAAADAGAAGRGRRARLHRRLLGRGRGVRVRRGPRRERDAAGPRAQQAGEPAMALGQALAASRCCRRSCAASSTSLWRHSAAR